MNTLNLSKLSKSKICLFLLGMVIIQASFGQINKVASVPVITEYQITDSGGIHNYTFMVENREKDELYVSYSRGVQVVNTKTFSVRTIPLELNPAGMCLDRTTGNIVVIDAKAVGSSEIDFRVIDPISGSSQFKWVATAPDQFVYGGVCSFGTDGKTLYFGNKLHNYEGSAKLIAVDTATWKIAWTWSDVNRVDAILPLPNGKVYFVTEYPSYTKPTYDLMVLDLDGVVKKVDLGGVMPTTLNLGPNGHIYASGLEIDPATNEVLNSNRLTRTFTSWSSSDSNYAYVASSLAFVDVANKSTIAYANNVLAYGMTAKRQADGSDLIAVLTDSRVDFYKYTPNVPLGVITAVTDLYYGVAPVVSTRYTPGDILTVWGEKLCPDFPIVLQVPPPIPLRKELAGCSVRIVDSQGNEFLGSLYFISSYQINVQLPSSMATGIAKLSVKDTTKEGIQETSPVFLSIKSAKPNYVQYAKAQIGYLAALHNENGSLVTAENPAKAGDAISLYAVGLGETSPKVPAGELALAPITGKVEIKVNGVSAQVLWAGLQGQYAGLYQINFIVPDGVTASEIVITVTQTDGTVQTDNFVLESL